MNSSDHVGLREARAHLSRYLRMVRKGVQIVITDRGRPVGKIVPMGASELPLAERIKRLEDQGAVESRREQPPGKIPAPIPLTGSLARKLLRQDRNNG